MDGKREMNIEIASAEQRLAEGRLRLRTNLEQIAVQGRRAISSPWLMAALATGGLWVGYRLIGSRVGRFKEKKAMNRESSRRTGIARLLVAGAGALAPALARRHLPFSLGGVARTAWKAVDSWRRLRR